MLISCREAARLASQGLDRRLSWGERVRLRLHVAICRGCANFARQVQFLRMAVKRLGA